MKVEFQKKGCEREAHEVSFWAEVLWCLTDVRYGRLDLDTVGDLKTRGFTKIVDGLEDQNDDLAVLGWNNDNGDLYFAGIKVETLETLWDSPREGLAELLCKSPKEELVRLLCLNQEFLKSLDLHYLKIDGEEILSYCEPKNPLMPNELRFF